MQIKESDLEFALFCKFREYLSEDFDVLLEPLLEGRWRADITISRGSERLAVIEVKAHIFKNESRIIYAQEQVNRYASIEGSRYAIIAGENNYFSIRDCTSNSGIFRETTFEKICELLERKNDQQIADNDKYRDGLFGLIKDFFINVDSTDSTIDGVQISSDNKSYTVYEKNKNLISFMNHHNQLSFIIEGRYFYFEDESIEDVFFQCLVKKFNGKEVCRYTSLASLFRTINDKSQSMCCIAGMNDNSECTYADNYVSINKRPESLPIKTLYEASQENNYFILSCMDLGRYDDLTMWRLYGDNTKGTNILYSLKDDYSDSFKLYYIDYAEESGDEGHLSLNLIKILNELTIDGKEFRFRKWNEWKHFFKPYEYRDELEIRLLYNRKQNKDEGVKWILTNDYNIVCPLYITSLDNFPFVIKEIRLGPNCPDMEVNKLQLELLIKEKNTPRDNTLKNAIIQASRISSYRK